MCEKTYCNKQLRIAQQITVSDLRLINIKTATKMTKLFLTAHILTKICNES